MTTTQSQEAAAYSTPILGIDIGGTGIKAAPVDLGDGTLLAERARVPTPRPATPDAVAAVVAEMARRMPGDGPIGIALPAVVRDGVATSAANIDRSWIGTDAVGLFASATGRPVRVVNDADAAGLAMMRYGVGRGRGGTVVMVTLGTGIGTAVFVDGQLVPNIELGHLEVRGKDAERRASERARVTGKQSWKKWSRHVDDYLRRLERILNPSLIVIGGGVSAKADRFLPRLTVTTEVVAARLGNDAGIVGAALAAHPSPVAAPAA